ncbi:MAG: hypothetical protein ACD_76C00053G0004 [uncultured bacterium]|nr:MAG: hypothetical protein ACD_76C00053G0004 [uncultured bacterium]HBD05630.1 hypothetical protein [Candidatus Uhrbacteria bacterium]
MRFLTPRYSGGGFEMTDTYMPEPIVSINLVTWNGEKYVRDFAESLRAQTFRDFSVRVVDNGSTDRTVSILRELLPEAMIIQNTKNLGFAQGHNQGFRAAMPRFDSSQLHDRFIWCMNQDIVLKPDALEKLISCAKNNPECGSLQPKLLRLYSENINDESLFQNVKSDRIDSTGVSVSKSLRFTDRGAGELDLGQFDSKLDIFGANGACAFYRASALESAKIFGEYFDEDFFSYKEDVDLAWRLQLLGFCSLFAPDAVAYHYRGVYGAQKAGLFEQVFRRRSRRPLISFLSTRNQWLVMKKNMHFINALILLPRIAIFQFSVLAYLFLFEQKTLMAIFSAMRLLPRILKKRRAIMRLSKQSGVKPKQIRKLFV